MTPYEKKSVSLVTTTLGKFCASKVFSESERISNVDYKKNEYAIDITSVIPLDSISIMVGCVEYILLLEESLNRVT